MKIELEVISGKDVLVIQTIYPTSLNLIQVQISGFQSEIHSI